MTGHCRKCGRTFADQMLCPNCGVEASTDTPSALGFTDVATDPIEDGPSRLRRMVLGLIVTFAATHSLMHGAWAVAGALGATILPLTDQVFSGILMAAVFLGAMAAGCANGRAELTGMAVGTLAAVSVVGKEIVMADRAWDRWVFGLPMTCGLTGLIAGFAGRVLVRSAPSLPRGLSLGSNVTNIEPVKKRRGRIRFIRIVIGAGFAYLAITQTDEIRTRLMKLIAAGGGGSSYPFVMWQITAIGSVIGGVIAGSSTRRGLYHGGAAAVMAMIAWGITVARSGRQSIGGVDIWSAQFQMPADAPAAVAVTIAINGVLIVLGGILGAQLMPPAGRRKRRPAAASPAFS